MSLRARLTLLYTTLVGGFMLLFGVVVYFAVSWAIIRQIDHTLRYVADKIVSASQVNETGQISNFHFPIINPPIDVSMQIWENNGKLVGAFPNTGLTQYPFDQNSSGVKKPEFKDITTGSTRLRVYIVPLVASIDGQNQSVGQVQIAAKLGLVDAVQESLLTVLGVGTLIAIFLAGAAGWFTTRRALAPLEDVIQVALQITGADDLSRRIPYHGPPDDEVGQLIHAFNHTLSRLESLFHTQRRFLADVGHELRTPLTVIKGNTHLMRRMGAMDEESLASIETEVDRLVRLVGDLLLLAQAESGKIPMARQIVELDTLALEAMNQIGVLARDRLTMRLGEVDQVLVCGDEDRLKQVLVNLLGNAINYTPNGGQIIVNLAKSQNQARLTISDNGPGISAEDLPHIFERFYRAEKSRTRSRNGKGFGLGLSIAYWIVRNHGGRIEVDSKEGLGTTFCVWLPLAEGNCQPQDEIGQQ